MEISGGRKAFKMGGSESIRNFLGLAMSLRVESIYIVRRRRVKKKFLVFFFFFKIFHSASARSPHTKEVHVTLDERGISFCTRDRDICSRDTPMSHEI